jgi:hypothetical protein
MWMEAALCVLGVCGTIIAAILKLPWRNNGYVRKDVCTTRDESLKREIAELKERIRQISEDVKEILERMAK